MEIKTYFNRIIIKPDPPKLGFEEFQFSEEEVGGTNHGVVVAVADNIDDIKVGEHIHYSKKVEDILIEEEMFHIIWRDHAYYSLDTK